MKVGDPDGFGRFGMLDRSETAVTCHECGRAFRALVQHLRSAHSMGADAYRRVHGLPRGLPLTCFATSQLIAEQSRGRVGSESWVRFEERRDETLPVSQRRAAEAARLSRPAVRKVREEGARERFSGVQEVRGAGLWRVRLGEVVAFRGRCGGWPTCSVGASDESRRLGRWLVNQRRLWRTGRLPEWKVEALRDVGVERDPRRGRRA